MVVEGKHVHRGFGRTILEIRAGDLEEPTGGLVILILGDVERAMIGPLIGR
jgi:hypothetical protein